ncbi:MAG: hypothetical protein AAF735_08425 [Myxococcota bacterium]
MGTTTENSRDTLFIDVDGENVHPDSVDPRALLSLASSFFDILEKLASANKHPLVMTGLFVEDKCARVSTRTTDPELASLVVTQFVKELQLESPRHGLARLFERFHGAFESLPPGVRLAVGSADKVVPIDLPRFAQSSTFQELTVFRAKVLEAGGETPRVRVRSLLSDRVIRLQGDKDVIARMAHCLYREVDVQAELTYRPGQASDEGTILSFEPLDDSKNDIESLRRWVTDNVVSNTRETGA